MDNFEVYEDEVGEFRYRVKGNNGEIVAVSEGFTRRYDAERGIETIKGIVAAGIPVESVRGEAKHRRREADGGLPRTPVSKVQEYIAAAHCYLSAAHSGNAYDMRMIPMDWPWRPADWKPGTKLENMEKAESILRETISIYKGEDD